MSMLNSLAAIFRNWMHRTKTEKHTQALQVLELELSHCQRALEQAQQDLKYALDEQMQTERWLYSTKKQFGIRERQIKYALQQGEIQIAKELAEDMVDLEALIEQEESSLRILANRAIVLRGDIQDGIQAIETHQVKLNAFKANQIAQRSETLAVPLPPKIDRTELKESLQFLKGIHQALEVDLQSDHILCENKDARNRGASSASTRQTKKRNINALLMRAKTSLEVDGY